MNDYLKIFIDDEYPEFLDKYLTTKTLERLRHVTQFCGSDYTNLYSPRFLYTRFDHSLVVAHMTWHFTHDKKETIASLLHDIGTPCFAHCIDYVFGDYIKQETSEKNSSDVVLEDKELVELLKLDGMTPSDIEDLKKYQILENSSPKLCTDRLDGVLHTCYIWLHTHELPAIKEVYDNMVVLTNEENNKEIGFTDVESAQKFVDMVTIYAYELQGNTDKFVMKYISEAVKKLFTLGLIEKEDLYKKKEEDIASLLALNIPSWDQFATATVLEETEEKPNNFSISFATKKRNVIPLVQTATTPKRITELSETSKTSYEQIKEYKSPTYAYVKTIQTI